MSRSSLSLAAAHRLTANIELEQAKDALREHGDHHSQNLVALEDARERLKAHHVAKALGVASADTAPVSGIIADLEAAVNAGAPVQQTLQQRINTARATVAAADRAYRGSLRAYLTEQAVNPARLEIEQALDQLGKSLAKLAAAHFLTKVTFAEPEQQDSYSANHGPAGDLLRSLNDNTKWPFHPYIIKPDWISKGQSFSPYHNDAIKAAEAQLRSALKKEIGR